MTTISATTLSPYPSMLLAAGTRTTSSDTAGTGTDSAPGATSVTLSDAARAALAQKDFATVVAETRAALDTLLANGTKPANANLQSLDRRQLFAVSSNAEGKFSAAEQAAAKAESGRRRDAALAGPLAVARVTDDIEGLYTAALAWLDGAATEEKSTPDWTTQRAALLEAQKQLDANPSATPNVAGDMVADYIDRMSAGDTGTARAFADVASDARAALDKQIADARADGVELVFSMLRRTGRPVDFSAFDSRSLSAVALNQGDKFTAEETLAARLELHGRSSATLLAGLKAATGSDPSAFAKNLLSAYGSMSAEERQAAGWSDKLYAAAVASYRSNTKIASFLGGASGAGGSGALTLLGTAQSDTAGGATSLATLLS